MTTAHNEHTGASLTTAGKGSLEKCAQGWEGIFGKKAVAGADFENERILSETTQSPLPASLKEYLKQEREAHEHYDKLFGEELPVEIGHFMVEDYMCPNCVKPWKCNGPHIEEGGSASTTVMSLDFHDSQPTTWIRKHLGGGKLEYEWDDFMGWVIKNA